MAILIFPELKANKLYIDMADSLDRASLHPWSTEEEGPVPGGYSVTLKDNLVGLLPRRILRYLQE